MDLEEYLLTTATTLYFEGLKLPLYPMGTIVICLFTLILRNTVKI